MLTADGVRRLREVREMFRAHPERYDNSFWFFETSCGTRGCVAGWLCHLAGSKFFGGTTAHKLLGFSGPFLAGETAKLFTTAHWSPETAIVAINAFLWQYGYPPDDVLTPEPESAMEVGVHN